MAVVTNRQMRFDRILEMEQRLRAAASEPSPPEPVRADGVLLANDVAVAIVHGFAGDMGPRGETFVPGDWSGAIMGRPLPWPRWVRDRLLAQRVDPYLTNAPRFADLSPERQSELLAYRAALLSWPDDAPNPATALSSEPPAPDWVN